MQDAFRTPTGSGKDVMQRLQRFSRWVEKRPLALSLLAIVIATGVTVLMANAAGLHAVRGVLDRFDPIWLLPLLLARVISYAGYTAAHHATIRPGRHKAPRLRTAFKTVAFGAAATSLAGGFSIDHRAMRGAGATSRQATVRVLNLGALELATLALAGWASALALLGAPHVQLVVTVPWVVGVPVGCVLALSGSARLSARSLARKGRIGRALARVLEAGDLMREQLRHPLRCGAAWSGMVAYWAGEILSLWAALRLFGQHPAVAAVILAYATGHVLTPRSLPLSGVGVTEVLLPLALASTGIALAAAVPAVFAYRIALLALSIPPALIAHKDVMRLIAPKPRPGVT